MRTYFLGGGGARIEARIDGLIGKWVMMLRDIDV